jgi:hypothetical protein
MKKHEFLDFDVPNSDFKILFKEVNWTFVRP